jgi:hypothetical protein
MVFDVQNNAKSIGPVILNYYVHDYCSEAPLSLDKLIAMREYSLNPVILLDPAVYMSYVHYGYLRNGY